MTLPWYPRDMGKYARDTGTLSLAQHGAYNLLLDHYYSTGPINAFEQCSSNAQLMPDHSPLYRLCKAVTKAEQEAVDFVLRRYFSLEKDGFYHQKTADEIMKKQIEKHENRVNAPKKAKENREKAMLKQCSSNTRQIKTKTIKPPVVPLKGDETTEPQKGKRNGKRLTAHERKELALDRAERAILGEG